MADGFVAKSEFQALNTRFEALTTAVDLDKRNLDIAWIVLCATLIFFMQAGFAMLEAGIVHPKNVTNILFKNMVDASLAALVFWGVGYGVAYGPTGGGFIGTADWGIGTGDCAIRAGSKSGLTGSDGWELWFMQWAFAAKAVSIISGSVAERTAVHAYFIYSCVFSIFIYPVVAHWVWGHGFLSAWGAMPDADGNARPLFTRSTASNGLIDFAGCGVVHMVGGFTGLVGAIIVGPRTGRFVDGQVIELYSGNKTLQALGTFILWFGWYGFNAGSTLGISGNLGNVAAKVVVNTTLAGATAGVATTFIGKLIFGCYDISMALNGVLCGLVSITANCQLVEPWHAIIIGFVGSILLFLGHFLLKKLRVDDPCDAAVVHGICGTWGLWATGIFCLEANVQYAAYPNVNNACKTGEQFGVQVVGSLAIFAWTVGISTFMFLCIKYSVGMRISSEHEDMGLDISEHGHGYSMHPSEFESSMRFQNLRDDSLGNTRIGRPDLQVCPSSSLDEAAKDAGVPGANSVDNDPGSTCGFTVHPPPPVPLELSVQKDGFVRSIPPPMITTYPEANMEMRATGANDHVVSRSTARSLPLDTFMIPQYPDPVPRTRGQLGHA